MTEDINVENMEPGMEVTEDDKLWALLAYVLSPIVPIIILLMEDKKNRPFLRAHNAQALVWGLINVVISVVIGWITCGIINLALWLIGVYWGYQAYQGKMVEIPVISKLVRDQGWA
ncbi:MAG TPA: hypothetical protein VE553_04265 [Candidatus Binatia bacterium]|jgi:uncharacterized membrane protein|nr:hypothetical protein [Candidatus Binatia bacterium]